MAFLDSLGAAGVSAVPPHTAPEDVTLTVTHAAPTTSSGAACRIVVVAWQATGVADSQGNTYNLDASAGSLKVYSAPVTTALAAGVDTITVTATFCFAAEVFHGIDPAAPFHTSAGASGTYSDETAPVTATTAPDLTLDAFDQVVVACGNQFNVTTLYWGFTQPSASYPFATFRNDFTGGGYFLHDEADGRVYTADGSDGTPRATATFTATQQRGSIFHPDPDPAPVTYAVILVAYHLLGWDGGGSTVPPPPANRWPENLESRFGQYYRAEAQAGNVIVKRAQHHAPPYEGSITVTSGSTDSRVSLCQTPDRRLWLLFNRGGSGGDVYETFSDADGENWSTPVVAFAGGTFNDQTVNPHSGARFRAALVGNDLRCIWSSRGDTTIAEFTATDEATGDPLVLNADDGFSVDYAPEGPERILGLFHIDGETELSDWISSSSGQVWTRV